MELFDRIRPVKDDDKLEYFSYTKLDVFDNCPYRYKLQYLDNMKSSTESLATEIGTILHKVLELKARSIINNEPINYPYLLSVLENGIEEKTEKGTEKINGISKLSAKYYEDFFTTDEESGMNYSDKVDLFINEVITSRLENESYLPVGCEVPFDFVYNYGNDEIKEVIFHGFIDSVRLDPSTGNLKIVDYKSSRKTYVDTKIKTPMQMFIYDLACYSIYKRAAFEHEYDFILINKKQNESDGVCSNGYLARGEKKLNKELEQIEQMKKKDVFVPKPSPLCYWCFANNTRQTPNADPKFSGRCQYYSLWKPSDKNFSVNQKYGEEKERRELVF